MASSLVYIQAKKNVKFPSDAGFQLNVTPLIRFYYLIILDQANAAKNRTNIKFEINPKTGDLVLPVIEHRNDGHFSVEQTSSGIFVMSDPNLTPPGLYNIVRYPFS